MRDFGSVGRVVRGFPFIAAQEADSPAQPHVPSQAKVPRGPRAEVRSVSATSDDFGPVLEILATHPLTPQIQTVENPLRLVIDLPNSTLSTTKRRIAFRNEQIKSIRLNQYSNGTRGQQDRRRSVWTGPLHMGRFGLAAANPHSREPVCNGQAAIGSRTHHGSAAGRSSGRGGQFGLAG